MSIHFVAPNSMSSQDIKSLLSKKLDQNYPYWLGGAINWVVQSYLVLRQYREGMTISTQPASDRVNIAHVTTWRKLPRDKSEYRVSIRADYRRLFDVDFEILQNPAAIQNSKQAYITYWPLPGIQPRDSNRQTVQNIAYAGRIGNRNIAINLQKSNNSLKDFNFKIIEKNKWHDMRKIDVLLAIRDFSQRTYDEKPPSKLINAWHAGIPLIAGYDSAFSTIGTPGIDYIQVKTRYELRESLERLRNDPSFYNRIVKAGRIKSKNYTRNRIAQTWLDLFEKVIEADFESSKHDNLLYFLSHRYNHFLDFIYESASVNKARLKRKITETI